MNNGEQAQEVQWVVQGQGRLGGGQLELVNTDHGSQFTSESWVDALKEAKVAISMEGRGRVFDNISVKRLWRNVKVKDVYLLDRQTVQEARQEQGQYLAFYNEEKPRLSHPGGCLCNARGSRRPARSICVFPGDESI